MTVLGFRLLSERTIPLDFHASSLDELTGSVSDGFYSTFSTLAGGTRVLGLKAHLDRLYEPAQALGLPPSVDEKTLRKRIAGLAKENLPGESRIRLILARDTGSVYIGIQPFSPLPESIYEKGVSVITTEMARHDPRIKGTDFITQSAEQRKLLKGDVFEILMTRNEKILEGMTSNFYAVRYVIARRSGANFDATTKQSPINVRLLRADERRPRNDILITAQRGILLGVTRRAVLRIARGQGMSIEFHPPRLDESFDEAFLTSSSRGVVPIVKIGGKPVGQGMPGVWTKRLSLAYQAYVRERSEEIAPNES
jgi:branched-subunit amino acid aminotransferase/4-amino-4-deoxychorismate lyase